MHQRIALAVLILSAAACKKAHRVDPVSVVGIQGCGKSDFMHPILVRMSGADGKNELLIHRQQNSRVGVPGDKETTWDVEVFQCSNMFETESTWECEIPKDPYYKAAFTYDPKSPGKLTIVPPKEGIRCREEVPVNVGI